MQEVFILRHLYRLQRHQMPMLQQAAEVKAIVQQSQKEAS
jgi:hypothetical protein